MIRIQDGDILPLLIVALIFYWIGKRAVSGDLAVKAWSWRIATVTFIAMLGMNVATKQQITPADLFSGSGWGLLAGAMVLGPSFLLLGMLFFVVRKLRGATRAISARRTAKRQRHALERERRRAFAEQQRNRPEMDRQARLAEERRQITQASIALGEKRREDARASCELAYALHASEIGQRFTHQMFEDFIAKYMTDQHSPEDVERRAAQLRNLIEQHHRIVKPPPAFSCPKELTDWYEQEKAEIQHAPLDQDLKDIFLAQLLRKYTELRTEFFEKAEV